MLGSICYTAVTRDTCGAHAACTTPCGAVRTATPVLLAGIPGVFQAGARQPSVLDNKLLVLEGELAGEVVVDDRDRRPGQVAQRRLRRTKVRASCLDGKADANAS